MPPRAYTAVLHDRLNPSSHSTAFTCHKPVCSPPLAAVTCHRRHAGIFLSYMLSSRLPTASANDIRNAIFILQRHMQHATCDRNSIPTRYANYRGGGAPFARSSHLSFSLPHLPILRLLAPLMLPYLYTRHGGVDLNTNGQAARWQACIHDAHLCCRRRRAASPRASLFWRRTTTARAYPPAPTRARAHKGWRCRAMAFDGGGHRAFASNGDARGRMGRMLL